MPSDGPWDAPEASPGATRVVASRPFPTPPWMTLAGAVIIIAGMHLGRHVLIPVALSLLLSFLLGPLMTRLRHIGFNRVLAVITSVTIGSSIALGILGFVAVQVVDLAGNLPLYQNNIEEKIDSVRATPDGTFDRTLRMFYRLNRKIKDSADPTSDASDKATPSITDPIPPRTEEPAVAEKSSTAEEEEAVDLNPMGIIGTLLNTTLGPLTTGGIVIVFVIFILLERESIRNRVIRLLGNRPGQMFTSTQALDDAANRVSRYLMMQLMVNVTYGIPIGIGLYFIGVPNAILWGVIAIVLRFIPYVGPIVAGIGPVALAFAVDPGWGMLMWTILLYTVIELISNNFVEPLAYGTSTGISSVGIILSAVFWAWVWGPIGLLVSTPLTVCFVVLGRHIPTLSFFPLLLSDQPVLPVHGAIYQRLLAMDPDEPDELAEEYLDDHSLEEFYENVILPLLNLIEEEQTHSPLDPAHRTFVLEHVRDLIEEALPYSIAIQKEKDKKQEKKDIKAGNEVKVAAQEHAPPTRSNPKLICVPAHDETDELAGIALCVLLNQRNTETMTLSSQMLSSERLDRIAAIDPPVVCISVLPPFALFHARHAIKRIRRRFPDIKIVVGFWNASPRATEVERRLKAMGAHSVVKTLKQATESLASPGPRQPKPDPSHSNMTAATASQS